MKHILKAAAMAGALSLGGCGGGDNQAQDNNATAAEAALNTLDNTAATLDDIADNASGNIANVISNQADAVSNAADAQKDAIDDRSANTAR